MGYVCVANIFYMNRGDRSDIFLLPFCWRFTLLCARTNRYYSPVLKNEGREKIKKAPSSPPSAECSRMSAERLELSTNGLKGHCSTIELRAPGGMHSIMLHS